MDVRARDAVLVGHGMADLGAIGVDEHDRHSGHDGAGIGGIVDLHVHGAVVRRVGCGVPVAASWNWATAGLHAAMVVSRSRLRVDLRSYQRYARASLQIVLDGLFVTPAVTAIAEALTSAHVEGKLAVIGNAQARGRVWRPTTTCCRSACPPRAAKRLTNALADLSSIETSRSRR